MHTLYALLVSLLMLQPAPGQTCARLNTPLQLPNKSWIEVPFASTQSALMLDVTLDITNPLGSGSTTPILLTATYGDDATLLRQWNYTPVAPQELPTTQMVVLGNHNLLLANTLESAGDTLSLGLYGGDDLNELTINSICTQSVLYPLAPQ